MRFVNLTLFSGGRASSESSGVNGVNTPTINSKVPSSKQLSLTAIVAADGFNLIELTADHTGRGGCPKGPPTLSPHTSVTEDI